MPRCGVTAAENVEPLSERRLAVSTEELTSPLTTAAPTFSSIVKGVLNMKPKREFIVSSSLAIALVLAGHCQMKAIFAAAPQAGAAQAVVPAEFIGDWVPASATCASPARFRAEGSRLTLINGQDSASYGDLHMAASYFGPEYSGISKVIVPDINKNDPPFMAFFNHEEKKGVALLDIHTESALSPHAAVRAMQMAHKKLAQRFPLNNIPLKKCAGGGATAGVAARPAGGQPAPAQVAQRQNTVKAPPRNPPVCPGVQFCEEVNDFAVTITDFRASLNAPTKVLTATLRFRNKSDHPVTLGYIPGSGVGTDERSNRYAANDADVRGIGLISGRNVDDKFVLQPGQESDARFTYLWGAGRAIFGTTFEIELTVREIIPLENNQLKLGAESPLRFTGLTHRSISGTVSQAPAPVSTPVASAQPQSSAAPQPQVDHCAGSKQPCYDAGPFSATLVGLTQAMAGVRHHTVRMTIAFKNWTDQPLILGYKNASNTMTDNLSNAYYYGRPNYDGSVQGIGIVVPGRSSDSKFRLAPGQSSNATFTLIRFEAGNRPKGTAFTLDTVIIELRILPNGQQTEIVREYSVHLPDMAATGGAVAPSVDSLSEAGRKLGDIFRKKK